MKHKLSEFWKILFRGPPDFILEYDGEKLYKEVRDSLLETSESTGHFSVEYDDNQMLIRVWRHKHV